MCLFMARATRCETVGVMTGKASVHVYLSQIDLRLGYERMCGVAVQTIRNARRIRFAVWNVPVRVHSIAAVKLKDHIRRD
jgi:hypothetical protein